MPEIDIIDRNNKAVSKVNLHDEIFGVGKRPALIHEAVVNHLANVRQGTASTKVRGEVRGGGAKPYKQKGTGRARAGSNRSPLWRGGGTIFGPKPRSYAYSMPKKMRRAAVCAALSFKFADGEVMVVDDISISEPKTKRVVEFLKGLGLSGKLTFIISEKDEALELAARNLPYVKVFRTGQFGVYDIVNAGRLLISKDAVKKIEEAYLG